MRAAAHVWIVETTFDGDIWKADRYFGCTYPTRREALAALRSHLAAMGYHRSFYRVAKYVRARRAAR